jgi:hypothetical protein
VTGQIFLYEQDNFYHLNMGITNRNNNETDKGQIIKSSEHSGKYSNGSNDVLYGNHNFTYNLNKTLNKKFKFKFKHTIYMIGKNG